MKIWVCGVPTRQVPEKSQQMNTPDLSATTLVIIAVRHKRIPQPRRPCIQNKADYYRLLLQVTREQEMEPWLLYVIKGIAPTRLILDSSRMEMQESKRPHRFVVCKALIFLAVQSIKELGALFLPEF